MATHVAAGQDHLRFVGFTTLVAKTSIDRRTPLKFMLFVLPTVPATLEDRKRLRPIGRNNERYQQMLDELRKLAAFADDAGFDVMATTEHHFHSEGYETSVAPLLLYADLAARTKRIKFAPLGLVLPSWDPLRAAEELAVLDHLTKGRIFAGFARGSPSSGKKPNGSGFDLPPI